MTAPGGGLTRVKPSSGGFTVRHLFLLLPWVAVGVAGLRTIRDNSFLWHVRAGSVQLEAGEVLTYDPFSFTFSEQPWRTQSWLVELGFGWAEQRTGLGFVPLWMLAAGLVLILAVGIYLFASSRDVTRTAVGLAMFAWFVPAYLVPRPVLVSHVWLALLVLSVRFRPLRWAVPLVVWLWAATHGSFVVGLVYLVLISLRSRSWVAGRHVLMALGIASLTAHGWSVWATSFRFFENRDALDFIIEWAPPRVLDFASIPFFAGLVGIIYQAGRGRVSVRDLWIVTPFLLFGLTSSRALMPALIVLLPWMVPELRVLQRPPSPVPRAALVITAVVIALLPLLLAGDWGSLDTHEFPVAAAQHLDSGARTLHDDSAGGYLIYAFWPDLEVFVDDRAELYGSEHFADLVHVRSGGPRSIDILDEWAIDQVLVDTDDGLSLLLAEEWTEVFRDDEFVVYSRG